MTEHIRINDVAPRIHYEADGVQSAFTYPFAIFKAADLEVWFDDIRLSSGFTVSGIGVSAGGTVLLAVPPAMGTRLTLRRRLPLARITDFQADGIIRSKALNDELDYQVAATQQVAEEAGRAVKRSMISASTADLTLPEPVAGAAVKWNAAGNGLENSIADVDGVIATATSLATAAAASQSAAAADALATAADRIAVADDKSVTHADRLAADGAAGATAADRLAVAANTASASASAITASEQAGIATTQATSAAASAATATAQAAAAAASTATATTEAATATTQAASAAASATIATAQAATATTQAGIATTQAAGASNSATAAAGSASAAAASATAALVDKVTWRGAWSGATAYAVRDAVQSGGSSYVCTQAHANQLPPNVIYWDLMASKGVDGIGAGNVLNTGASVIGHVPKYTDTTGTALADGYAIGTAANNLVQLDASAKLPAIDGSQLTGLIDQSIRDQLALTNLRLALNSSVASGALHQGYQWELLTDEWAAGNSGGTYAAGSPAYYANLGGYTATVIPTMTSNTTPSGIASQSSTQAGAAWNAYDGVTSNAAIGMYTNAFPAWSQYQFPTAKTITRYSIIPDGGYRWPVSWQFQGANNPGSGWTTLHTVTGESTSGWTGRRYYAFANTTPYLYYRLYVTAGTDASYLMITEIEMMESITPPNMTLVNPTAVSVSAPPSTLDAYFLWKDDSGSAVLGSDLSVDLSRDGGTTWTVATLTNLLGSGGYDGTYAVIKARADLTAQPTGTSLKCRIKTLNTKVQRVAAPALYKE